MQTHNQDFNAIYSITIAGLTSLSELLSAGTCAAMWHSNQIIRGGTILENTVVDVAGAETRLEYVNSPNQW
jgi:hypothetical protein